MLVLLHMLTGLATLDTYAASRGRNNLLMRLMPHTHPFCCVLLCSCAALFVENSFGSTHFVKRIPRYYSMQGLQHLFIFYP